MPVTPSLWMLRQDPKFESSLGHRERLSLKKKKEEGNKVFMISNIPPFPSSYVLHFDTKFATKREAKFPFSKETLTTP